MTGRAEPSSTAAPSPGPFTAIENPEITLMMSAAAMLNR